jgi:hypothetical protein
MRQYPIWVDMVNNSYNASKSYGVSDYNIQHVKVGTSSRNSFDFAKIEMGVVDTNEDGTYNEPKLIKTYKLFVDDKLIKKAVYNSKTKVMEDVEIVPYAMPEDDLKAKFFKKWKAEAEAKDQDFRNERFAHRLAVNG